MSCVKELDLDNACCNASRQVAEASVRPLVDLAATPGVTEINAGHAEQLRLRQGLTHGIAVTPEDAAAPKYIAAMQQTEAPPETFTAVNASTVSAVKCSVESYDVKYALCHGFPIQSKS